MRTINFDDPSAPLVQFADSFEAAHQHLVPIVRSEGYVGDFRLTARERRLRASECFEPLAGGLWVGLAYDTPTAIVNVGPDHLDHWNTSRAPAMAAALSNLRALSPGGPTPIEGGLFRWSLGDGHDATRLLLTDTLSRLPVDGELLAMVPSRGCLLVAGSRDPAALSAMLRVSEEVLAGDRPVNGQLLRLSGDRWVEAALPPTHPLANEADALQSWWLGEEYARQKARLRRIHEAENVDVAITRLIVGQESDGSVVTIGTWVSCGGLVPKARLISFVDVDPKTGRVVEPSFRVRWQDAESVVGHLMRRDPELLPVRYEVDGYPTPADLVKLRALAIRD